MVKNGYIRTERGVTDFIVFGSGEKILVMLPGVGDGLKTVRGMALPFALLYRSLAKDFRVYVFSRRRDHPKGMTTREMARDLDCVMEKLGLYSAAVVGVSQGGMIAQWLAIDHPNKVGKLVLVVTLSRPNAVIKRVIGRWLKMAARGDYKGIMLDTAKRSYSEKRIRQSLILYRLLGSFDKPRSFDRFVIQARSCVTHNAYEMLERISCPTLVIGGTEDKIVTSQASIEIAEKIPGARLFMYEGLSHGLYEEAPDFLKRISAFCR